MVCNLTRGRAEFAAAEDQIKALVVESEAARAELEQLLQDDTAAYNGVTAAQKMPRDSAEQQAARSAAVQAGLVGAANVPLAICRVAVEVCRLARTAAEIGNPRAVTDAGIAAVLGEAAAVGASLNVKINLGAIEDQVYVQAVDSEVDQILAAATALRGEVLAITAAKLQAANGEKS
jgi:formiminotetrahydrofolate cyclodeaminase